MTIDTVICDFDGTLTDSEASLGGFFPEYERLFIEALGIDPSSYARALGIVQTELRADPNKGWELAGHIVAPINSDPFAFNTASHTDLLKRLREGRFEGMLSPSYVPNEKQAGELTNKCHLAAYGEKNIVFRDGAKRFVEGLLQVGYNVTIVSNSGTAAIEKALEDNGFSNIPVIGMARKYLIDPRFTNVPVGVNIPGLVRQALLRRKLYNAVLERICPDPSKGVMVGDNFELDLVLPLHKGFAGVLTNTPAAVGYEIDYMNAHPKGMYAETFEQALSFIRER